MWHLEQSSVAVFTIGVASESIAKCGILNIEVCKVWHPLLVWYPVQRSVAVRQNSLVSVASCSITKCQYRSVQSEASSIGSVATFSLVS